MNLNVVSSVLPSNCSFFESLRELKIVRGARYACLIDISLFIKGNRAISLLLLGERLRTLLPNQTITPTSLLSTVLISQINLFALANFQPIAVPANFNAIILVARTFFFQNLNTITIINFRNLTSAL